MLASAQKEIPILSRSHVHVWSLDLGSTEASADDTVLSADERERAKRFKFDVHRDRFVKGRSFLRKTLGKYAGTKPEGLEFAYTSAGKPYLVSDRSQTAGLRFNVSHSENQLVAAICTHFEIGIDIEKPRSLPDEEQLARRFFQAEEFAEYIKLPPALRSQGFLNAWTRKEAILKARGDGLLTPLDSFQVSLDPRAKCRILRFIDLDESINNWQLLPIETNSDNVVSLALRKNDPKSQVQVSLFNAGDFS